MRGAIVVTCCWPGLSRLWLRGDVKGLAIAAGFAAVVNAALWLTAGLSQPLPFGWQATIWLTLVSVWLVSVWHSYRELPELCRNEPDLADNDLFIQLQTEYLKGNWFEAEGLALQLIEQSPRDIEAQLYLAGMYRHMNRLGEARQRLQMLGRLHGAAKWECEVERERRLIDRLREQPESDERPAASNVEDEPPATASRAA